MAVSKLSPKERLVRKRVAARLRQQRCRARKRLALIESPPKTKALAHESSKSTSKGSLPPRKLWKARIASFERPLPHPGYWSDSSSLRYDVGRSSSFDSVSTSSTYDSSGEERQFYNTSRNSSPSLEGRTARSLVSFDQDEKKQPSPFAPLPNNEEAAIDAMLSLKSRQEGYRRPIPTPQKREFRVPYQKWNHYGLISHNAYMNVHQVRPGLLVYLPPV